MPVSSLHFRVIFSNRVSSRRFSPQFTAFDLVLPIRNSGQAQTWLPSSGSQASLKEGLELTHL
jgi:hypothetical protein